MVPTDPATGEGAPVSNDRRVRRTRAALTTALLDALREDIPYAAITIDELAQRADVARATFYAHWADKDALYLTVLEDLAADVSDRFRRAAVVGKDAAFDGAGIYVAFRHAKENRALYLPMLEGAAGGGATRLFVRRLRDGLAASMAATAALWGTTPRLPLDVVAQAQAGAFFALLGYWLRDEDGIQSSTKEIAHVRHQHEVHGLGWVLGAEPGSYAVSDGDGPAAWRASAPPPAE